VTQRFRVCFVCTGNICRSPTAEAVLRAKLADAGLDHLVEVDSAGTGDWHAGDDMDRRSRRALINGGYDPQPHEAKQFRVDMFTTRDLVIALDDGHIGRLAVLAQVAPDVVAAQRSLVLLRSFDPAVQGGDLGVPDPYYGGDDEFREVLEMIEHACDGLIDSLAKRLASGLTSQH